MFNKKSYLSFLAIFIFVLIFPAKISAQVVVNEFSSWESSGDWVELYAFDDIDISGWILRDLAASKMYTVPDGTMVGPSSDAFFVAEVGNRLNRNGDLIKLLMPDDETIVDQLSYGEEGGVCKPETGQSAGRYPDANSTIERFKLSTKGVSNDSAELDPCPTPSPVPTSTSTPTPTPKPTLAPTPTNTPTPKPTVMARTTAASPIPTRKSMDSEKKEENGDNGIVSELRENLEPTEKEEERGERNRKFPLFAGVFIFAGIGFMGASFYPLYKKRRQMYNEGGDRKERKEDS